MNTNAIKYFAKQARIYLLNSSRKQLQYWGFDEKGQILEEPKPISGGFSFRGKVSNDTTAIPKWNALKQKLAKSKETYNDVAEEAAYTWFNRLVAIRILEKNDFIAPVLAFQNNSTVPAILQQAKAGNHSVSHSGEKANLQEALNDNDDDRAFAILIIQYCNSHPLLKEIFGHMDDYTELLIPQDLLASDGLVAMLNDPAFIPEDAYTEVELIGWLYQFYISDKKDEVFKGFKNNKKARPEDIPSATQIFTPKWIVNYMVENTVGKIYLDYEEDSELKNQMKYLVENETDAKSEIITDLTELTLIDPACGSGHILVTGFEWLYKMYREQGYSAKSAIENILKNNLFGLDLDDRAMQLSRFAVLLKSAQQLKQADVAQAVEMMGNPLDVIPHIYAFPERHYFTTEDVALFTKNKKVAEIHRMLELLGDGKNLGSALKLNLEDGTRQILEENYADWNARMKQGTLDLAQQALWHSLKNYVEVALVLTRKYTAIVANPPYMGQKSMNGELKNYINANYPMTKSDLFAVFMEVCLDLNVANGVMAMINQHSWMFLSSYENYREHLLNNFTIESMLHLGPRTFEEVSGEVVQSTAFVLQKSVPKNAKAGYYRLVDYKSNKEKEEHFLNGDNFYPNIPQTNFDKIPGSPIAYWVSEKVRDVFINADKLSDFSTLFQGMITGNNDLFLRNWFEVNNKLLNLKLTDLKEFSKKNFWVPYNKGGGNKRWYGNKDFVVNFKETGLNFVRSRTRFIDYYFKPSLSWDYISSQNVNARIFDKGFLWDVSGSSCFPEEKNLQFFTGLINSKVGNLLLKILNPTINTQVEDLSVLPLIIDKKNNADFTINLSLSLSKKDWDSRETSWDFVQNPLIASRQNSLKEAYNFWQEDAAKDFFQLHKNEEELNRIFIEIYGLQDELTREVPLKDITILQDELAPRKVKGKKKTEDEYAEEQESATWISAEKNFRENGATNLPFEKNVPIQQLISYLVGTMLGRYRLGKDGLHIAHPNPTEAELQNYPVENVAIPFQMQIDEDAILPIMGSACAFPDDAVKRTDDLIHKIWGEESHTENLNFINQCLGVTLEKWMTEQFCAYHISGTMYKKKPIYWMFCSNPKSPQKSAFRVLVYMHRMDAYTVQKIMRNYLHPHQQFLNSEYEKMKANEANLGKQEIKQMEVLAKQISELKEYNEVLKSLADQQITFDLDDSVTVNYAKFKGAVAEIK